MPRLAALALLVLVSIDLPVTAQGRLDAVRQEVRHPAHEKKKPCDSSDEDNFFGDLLSGLFAGMFAAGCEESEARAETRFLPHPYHADFAGFLWISRPGEDEIRTNVPTNPYSVRLLIDNANNFDGLNRLGGQVFLDTSCGFGIRTGYQWLHEKLSCGCVDNLGLGDVNVLYRLLQDERFQMHLGVGAVFLSDARRTDAGVNFTASFDIFPVRPIILSTQFDLGVIGSATMNHMRGTVGYQWRHWEVFGGYDYLRIGSVNLHGLVGGVRLWF